MNTARSAQLADNLAQARHRVSAAAARGDVPEPTIVAVTKRFPAADVVALSQMGITDVAENRVQEAVAKHAEYLELGGDPRVRWHFIGQLQSNKARVVATFTDSVDTIDRASLIGPLSRGAEAADRELDCLVQVSLAGGAAGQEHRGGCDPEAALALADQIAATPRLRLAGVMGMAPLGMDPTAAYTTLTEVAALVRAAYPNATTVSAGMSGDLDAAIAAGATHVRLGTAILGPRPSLG